MTQTFGERAVRLSFSPTGEVSECKKLYADCIDALNDFRQSEQTEDEEFYRLVDIAIQMTETAQMWAIKALTYDL